jgi:outer membrane protein assembly complex protein YaeT
MAVLTRPIRWILWGIGGLAALLVLLVALLHTPPARRFALRQVVQILGKQGVTFDSAQFNYNLLELRASLRDVVVKSPVTPDLPPLLRAENIDVDISLRTLLGGRFFIESGTIRNPEIHLVIDEKGRTNIPETPEQQAKQEETKNPFVIDQFEINGGRVRVEDRKNGLDARLPLTRIVVDGNPLTFAHDIRLVAGQGTLNYGGRQLPLQGVGADLLLREKDLEIRNLTAGLGDSTVQLSGTVNGFDKPKLNLKGDTSLALRPLLEFANVKQEADGTAKIRFNASGTIDRLLATAELMGDDLRLDRFRDVDLRATAQYDAAASRVRLESLNVAMPLGSVQGKADLALKPEAGTSSANISAQNLDLGPLTAAFDVPVRIASRATADVVANWPALQFEQATGNATVRLSPTRRSPANDLIPISGTLNAQTRGNRIVIGIPDLRVLDARATGQVTLVDRRNLAGTLQLQASNLGSTITAAEAFLGRRAGTLVGTPVSGPLNVRASLNGTVQNPALTANLEGNQLSVGDLNGINVAAEVDYNPARLVLKAANVNWREQEITAQGVVGLKGSNPTIDLAAKSDEIALPTVLAGLGKGELPVQGQASFEAQVHGTTKQPQADVQLTARNLAAYEEVLGNLNLQAQLRGRTLVLSNLRLNKPQEGADGTLVAAGSYNLDAKTFNVEAKSENLRLTTLRLPDGRQVRAAFDIDAEGRGTADNPTSTARISAKDIQVGPQQLGDVNLVANTENQRAIVKADAPAFKLAATVDTSLQAPYPATFEARVNDLNLADLPVKVEQPITGSVTATVRGTGPLTDFLKQGQATAQVDALNLEYKGQPIRSEGPLVARYQSQSLTIDQATLVARDSRISLNGNLPLDPQSGQGAINLSAKLDLPSLVQYIPAAQPPAAQGVISIDGTIQGNLKRIDPNINIQLVDGSFAAAGQKTPVTNVDLQAQIRNGALEIATASAQFGVAQVMARGTVPFALLPANLPVELPRRQGRAEFTAELQKLNIADLDGVPEKLGGTVSARLDAQAATPDLQALDAKLTFPDLQVSVGSYALAQKGTSEIVVQNGVAQINQFVLTGPSTDIQIAGTAGLTGARPLNVNLLGNFDAAIASAFTDAVSAQGPAELRVAVNGTAQTPQAQGYFQLTKAQLGVREPRVALEDLDLRVDLAGTRATVSQLSGVLNGGDLVGGGSVEYANGVIQNANLNLKASDVYMNVPEGLRTISNINLTVNNQGPAIVVGGTVEVAEGSYTDDRITRTILARATAPKPLDLTEQPNPFIQNIQLNIGVFTQNPIVVDNSLAEAEIVADLRVIGNPYQPGLSGRVTIEEGGELRFQERTYLVDRGVITFTGERNIEPTLDILATTNAGGYDITLQVSGETGDTETTLTSDPPLPEPDILALLVTGKTMDEIRGQEFEVARNQVLSYLTGRVGSQLGQTLSGATGLSTVRIEPNLIAAEADPSARLTIGQDITRNLGLIYSVDLVNSSDQIYVAEYDVTRRFTTRGVRQADGSFRFDFRHDVRFGGVPEPRRGAKRIERLIGNVRIIGNNYFTEEQLADKLKAKTGKRYDYLKLRKGLDRIEQLYAKQGLLESRVRLSREQSNQTVDLTLNVQPGPKVDLIFEGAQVPNDLQKELRETWQSGVFDIQRLDDTKSRLQAWLVEDGFLQPRIEHEVNQPSPEVKRVVFDIQPGTRFRDVELVFEGARGFEQDRLREVVKDQKLTTDVFTAPGRVTDTLTRLYQEFGFLDAEVAAPRYELNPQTATGRVVFPVTEGPEYRIRNVDFQGNSAFSDGRLAEAVPLPKGKTYRPVLQENSLERLKSVYWASGFNDVDVLMVLDRDKAAGQLDIKFQIAENRQAVVSDVVVEGNVNTSENLILTQLELKPGAVLDLQKVGDSRRNLYNTGAYSLVEILREELVGPQAEQTRARQESAPLQASALPQKQVRLRVRVREIQPFEVRYGGFFDTERGPGGILDLSNRNSLGSARVLGLRARYDSQLQEARLYFSQPLLRRFPVRTIISPFFRREQNPATRESDPFNVDRLGFSIQQEARPWENYILNYGYRFERTRTYDAGPNVLEALLADPPIRIGSLTTTLTRETRDEILDATRGSFLSHALQFSPGFLGSQRPFAKYFGQYFRYIPLQDERIELFTNEILRPRLVYAGGIRAGVARGWGGSPVPLSERFFAGGGTTIRGFEQNSLGPVGPTRQLLGGEAMLVINNEIRFPLLWIFDGVGFSDIGNVWASASDFSLTDIRKTAGVGLRVRTPWFLVRLDYGVKLDRRPGEGRGRLFFSIGQAF